MSALALVDVIIERDLQAQVVLYLSLCQKNMPVYFEIADPLQWRHNDYCSVSNHQPHGCLLNRLFRRRSKKTSKLRVTGLCAGNSPGPVNSPHKGPVTRKMFPFDDVIMHCMMSNYIESVFMKITDNAMAFVYRLPNSNIVQFTGTLNNILGNIYMPCYIMLTATLIF